MGTGVSEALGVTKGYRDRAGFAAATFWNLVDQRADETPSALFAVDEQDREITFAGLRDQALATAAALAARGVTAGTPVSWQLPTWLDSMVLTAALARLGVVQNPIIPIYREREVRFILEQTGARVFVVPGTWRRFDYAAMAHSLADQMGDLDVLIVSGSGSGGLPEGDPATLPPAPPAPATEAEQPVRWIYHTSGTTGEPKGARHTDATLAAGSLSMVARLEVTTRDRIGLVFPYAHIGGATFFMIGLLAGCPLVCVEAFGAATSIPFLTRQGVTLAGAGPAFHLAYLEAQRADGAGRVLPDVRAFPGGAAPKPVHLHAEMKRAFAGAGVVSGFGLTEGSILTMGSIQDADAKLATTEGRPLPHVDVRVTGSDGSVLGVGVEGEIHVRGPMVCVGYVDDALTEAAFDDEGFFATGDLGHLDEDGYLTISGRLKDVIIRNGENISAKEVEDLLFDLDDVEDVAVIGLSDPVRGERCCAVVVARQGREMTLAELVDHLRSRNLMAQKFPEQLEMVEALPRNPAGKVLKDELRRRYGPS